MRFPPGHRGDHRQGLGIRGEDVTPGLHAAPLSSIPSPHPANGTKQTAADERTVSLSGGAPVPVSSAPGGGGGKWVLKTHTEPREQKNARDFIAKRRVFILGTSKKKYMGA